MELPQIHATADQINPYFSEKSLLRELILQLKKDFSSAGIPIKLLLTRKYSYAELCETIKLAFDNLPLQTIFNLLYRVDVSESQLRKGMPTNGVDVDLLVQLIVKRELQKVVIRKLYSSSNKSDSGDSSESNQQ